MKSSYDAIVIGSGPNGFAAAVTLAEAGLGVLILEANETIGGGARSAELTLPGFLHDSCSAIHPLALSSPFFRRIPLAKYGLEFIQPPASVAHPVTENSAVLLKNSFAETVETLDESDRKTYQKLLAPFVGNWDALTPDLLAPLGIPQNPFLMAKFGWKAMRSARSFAESFFQGTRARAAFAGLAAHSMIPLETLPSAAFGLVLAISVHAVGWAIPRGGTQKITDALAAHFRSLGGEIQTGTRVETFDELPPAKMILCDLTPRQILKIAGQKLPENYKRRLEKFKYGMGAYKIDWALSEPIPWLARECGLAGTVHLGGNFDEIAASESAAWRGEISRKPYVLVAQQSLFDETRAPEGKHTGWAYCHVPHGSTVSMTEIIEAQIERYAPGFRECILARSVLSPLELERRNANVIGGDINGGAGILSQLFTRPVVSLNPYRMPARGLYICSSSTPPGGGVHGMCGFHAAQTALADFKVI